MRDLGRVVLALEHRPTIGMELKLAGLRVRRLRVVVGNDDDIRGAGEMVVILRTPLADPTGHRRRDIAEPNGVLSVSLALGDDHPLARITSGDELGQPVEHARDTREIPNPSALAVRPALLEAVLRVIEAHDLE